MLRCSFPQLVRRIGAFVAGALVAACEGPTGTGEGDARFDGAWRYEAQISGSTAQLVGQLQLDGAETGSIEGSFSAELVEMSGQRSPVSGLVGGSVVGSGVARLEVTLAGGQIRTHLSQLRGDSLVGDWVQSGSAPASGTFRAARVR
ncbi:MAG: hypothetical protein P3A32_02600 [Gemmatimonadota bacterium]|jgi:hypothetical protein|nr:hypothetical protein [Gemmatimonadota bacterium]MDQ8146976.1 hypothetical protein [Gemmatimonadota bacterium]MDQ8148699.1 hypothetical protein [Gemmatimonadota bacterium]MDQ8156107.1 hypothetical protein [Gemmatimonadota bacterium]MDQ8176391.1 hypothetical protein [Gemmatimonadota bacterium]